MSICRLFCVGGILDNTLWFPSMAKDTANFGLNGHRFVIGSPGIANNWNPSNEIIIEQNIYSMPYKAVLMGFSDGANACFRTACKIISDDEDVVRGLILISPGPEGFLDEPEFPELTPKQILDIQNLPVLVLYTQGELKSIEKYSRAYCEWLEEQGADVTIIKNPNPITGWKKYWKWLYRPHLYGIKHHLQSIIDWGIKYDLKFTLQ